MAGTRAISFLDRNLMAILMLGGSLYGGYVTGQAGTKNLEGRVAHLENVSNGRFKAWQCAVRTIDALKTHERNYPACELDVPE